VLFFPVRRLVAAICVFSAVLASACLVRRRVVPPPGRQANRPLLKATEEELIQRIHAISDPIRSFNMKVDMSPSVGGLYGGRVTDFPTISGYILYRKPDQIRVIGLDLVIHSTAFDMVSSGNDFRVSIPPRNQFIEGENDAPAASQNKLENLRPVAFLRSLLIEPPAPGTEQTILEDDTDETKAIYILMMVARKGDQLRLLRKVYFDRYTLQISRQKTFDASGYITGDIKYGGWKSYNGVAFPMSIDVQRPQDGYEVGLTVTDLKFNTPDVTAEKFVLNRPPGAQVKILK
jgi:hypothetical protein